MATSAAARRSGALLTTATHEHVVEAEEFEFLVRVVAHLSHKPRPASDTSRNPFLPYEPDLFVTEVGPDHVCLLNKFNVVDHHTLVVTRDFVHQDTLLTQADFRAWWQCLAAYPSLGFYNGGRAAGASQPHKHMQLVPLPLSHEHPQATLVPYLTAEAGRGEQMRPLDRLPIRHAFAGISPARWAPAADTEAWLWSLYGDMLRGLGLCANWPEGPSTAGPYNLLLTRDWMLLVPRRHEYFGTLSLNSLAYAGALLARSDEEWQRIREAGPWALWRATGFPSDPPPAE